MSAIAGTSLDDFLANPTDEVLAERYLERLIGRMIDINYHLLTEAGHPPPADYHASFTQLAGMGVLDHPFARQIAGCAGLRNRIVHAYDDLDPAKVHDALQAAVRDVPVYLTKVQTYLDGLS